MACASTPDGHVVRGATAVNMSALPPASARALAGVSPCRSTITFSGWRDVSTSRTVNRGSSCRIVPMPVRIAHERARHAWPSARAASPVIHWLAPFCSAVRPSRLAAIFTRTHGRPVCTRLIQPRLSSRASASRKPTSTSTPAARSVLAPRAATGSGSRIAATTRTMPAASSSLVQGGVRP